MTSFACSLDANSGLLDRLWDAALMESHQALDVGLPRRSAIHRAVHSLTPLLSLDAIAQKDGEPRAVVDRVVSLKVIAAGQRGAVAVVEMLEDEPHLPKPDQCQRQEAPGPSQRHGGAHLLRDGSGANSVFEASATPAVEAFQSRQSNVCDRQILAGAGLLEFVPRQVELLACEIGAQQLPEAAPERDAVPGCL